MYPLTTGQETASVGFVYATIYNHLTAEEFIKQAIGGVDFHPVKSMHYDLDEHFSALFCSKILCYPLLYSCFIVT